VRKKAAMGLFVTLVKPTDPMSKEAVKAGYYTTPSGTSFPKIQILTIEELLNGTEQAKYPDLMRVA
jgi:site-specific DNA-methyltransferase (adenine-specific)